MRGGDRLQVVNVVDKDALELVHGRIDIAGNSNIDKEHGPVAAAVHKRLAVLGAEDGVGRTGGSDHDVGVAGGLVQLVERNHARDHAAGESASQVACAIDG